MRLLIALAGLSLIGGAASAQTANLDRLRLQSVQQQNMRAQAQSNVLRRDDADVQRVAAEQQRRLDRATLRAADVGAPAYSAPPGSSGQIPAADDSLRRLQDRTLQDSNARLRAITPAS